MLKATKNWLINCPYNKHRPAVSNDDSIPCPPCGRRSLIVGCNLLPVRIPSLTFRELHSHLSLVWNAHFQFLFEIDEIAFWGVNMKHANLLLYYSSKCNRAESSVVYSEPESSVKNVSSEGERSKTPTDGSEKQAVSIPEAWSSSLLHFSPDIRRVCANNICLIPALFLSTNLPFHNKLSKRRSPPPASIVSRTREVVLAWSVLCCSSLYRNLPHNCLQNILSLKTWSKSFNRSTFRHSHYDRRFSSDLWNARSFHSLRLCAWSAECLKS